MEVMLRDVINGKTMRYFIELRYNGGAYCGWQRPILESKSKCNFLNIKMCGTKTCEKCRFLMRKGTKMALKPSGTL